MMLLFLQGKNPLDYEKSLVLAQEKKGPNVTNCADLSIIPVTV